MEMREDTRRTEIIDMPSMYETNDRECVITLMNNQLGGVDVRGGRNPGPTIGHRYVE